MTENHVMNTYKRYALELVSGKGTKVYDKNGKEYIDFVSGVAVNCLGHCPPAIVNTINEQTKKLIHVSNNYWNEYNIKLSNILCEYCDHTEVFFTNSGTEAIEGALKCAKKFGTINGDGNKNKIIYMNNSFHGRTLGSLSVTGQSKYQQDYLPLIPNTVSIDFNNIEQLKEAFDDTVCGIILEPVQGEGGINVATKEFLQTARDLCDKYNALLIFDEVQCGLGRLGTMFAYKSFGVIPDIICIAKALGGGFPIGAFLTNTKSSVLTYGDHGSTYGGNPLACAVGCTILKELSGGIIDAIPQKSDYIVNKLTALKEKYPIIEQIKGMGLLLGIKLSIPTDVVIGSCIEKGLLVIPAAGNVIRLLPPLNVSTEDIDAAIKILEEAIKDNK
ncbi:aspartate aminotransferase family protein [Clostridium oryzae]|nr:aspartate aminotransferase family protein [Clostridium oryzae]